MAKTGWLLILIPWRNGKHNTSVVELFRTENFTIVDEFFVGNFMVISSNKSLSIVEYLDLFLRKRCVEDLEIFTKYVWKYIRESKLAWSKFVFKRVQLAINSLAPFLLAQKR